MLTDTFIVLMRKEQEVFETHSTIVMYKSFSECGPRLDGHPEIFSGVP
jgi:hypothetical protein